MKPLPISKLAPADVPLPAAKAEKALPQSSRVLVTPPYTQAVLYKVLPSMLSPTKTVVLSPRGKVYAIPSTTRPSPPSLRSNSSKVPSSALPASIETSNESSPVKLVFRSIWKP